MSSRRRIWLIAIAALGVACSRRSSTTPADAGPTGGPQIRRAYGVIDWHTHLSPDAMDRADAMFSAEGITEAVNLSGGSPGRGLELQLAAAHKSKHHIHVFATLDFREAHHPGYGARLADQLEASAKLGAEGWKIPKGLGLGYRGPDGKLLPVDDPELDAVFERAGKLGMPIEIHVADPKAFWLPPTPDNERYAELSVHPGWSFYDTEAPPWATLLEQLERRIARHPNTTIVAAHFGCAPEEPERVGRMLDKYPNLYIDTAARVPEIGRHDAAQMRAFFEKYQDRIVFGTDLGVGADPADLMLGSTGATPPTQADIRLFWDATWRYFETSDQKFAGPTPIQGNWTINGIGLPDRVLRKLYHDNAAGLLARAAAAAAKRRAPDGGLTSP